MLVTICAFSKPACLSWHWGWRQYFPNGKSKPQGQGMTSLSFFIWGWAGIHSHPAASHSHEQV